MKTMGLHEKREKIILDKTNWPVPGIYKHYKGGEYDLVGVAKYSETLEDVVIYRARYDDKILWARPLKMFLDKVLVEGKLVPRFSLIKEVK
ncbi:MAG: DUF1653 domain-containing protein [Candidatus Paceibacterota bacterium]